MDASLAQRMPREGQRMVAVVKPGTPVLTGHLKASTGKTYTKKGAHTHMLVIESTATYARFVKRHRDNYVAKVNAQAATIVRNIIGAVDRAVRQATGGTP